MEIIGRVKNGVVVLEEGPPLPEGTRVKVVPAIGPAAAKAEGRKRRIRLPLVHCDRPGSVRLTNERVAKVLSAEDAAPRH